MDSTDVCVAMCVCFRFPNLAITWHIFIPLMKFRVNVKVKYEFCYHLLDGVLNFLPLHLVLSDLIKIPGSITVITSSAAIVKMNGT